MGLTARHPWCSQTQGQIRAPMGSKVLSALLSRCSSLLPVLGRPAGKQLPHPSPVTPASTPHTPPMHPPDPYTHLPPSQHSVKGSSSHTPKLPPSTLELLDRKDHQKGGSAHAYQARARLGDTTSGTGEAPGTPGGPAQQVPWPVGAVRQRGLQGYFRRSLGTTSRILGSCVSRRALGWVEGQRKGAVVVMLGSGDSAPTLGRDRALGKEQQWV